MSYFVVFKCILIKDFFLTFRSVCIRPQLSVFTHVWTGYEIFGATYSWWDPFYTVLYCSCNLHTQKQKKLSTKFCDCGYLCLFSHNRISEDVREVSVPEVNSRIEPRDLYMPLKQNIFLTFASCTGAWRICLVSSEGKTYAKTRKKNSGLCASNCGSSLGNQPPECEGQVTYFWPYCIMSSIVLLLICKRVCSLMAVVTGGLRSTDLLNLPRPDEINVTPRLRMLS